MSASDYLYMTFYFRRLAEDAYFKPEPPRKELALELPARGWDISFWLRCGNTLLLYALLLEGRVAKSALLTELLRIFSMLL